MWNLPNILTMTRILAIPLIVAAFYLPPLIGSWIAFVLFCAAGITDFFDGYLARSMGIVSRLGQFLDPIADKLMVGAVIVALTGFGWLGGVHLIPAVIILCREILVSGLREYLAPLKVSVPVSTLAKWKTTVQMVSLGALVWGPAAPTVGLPAYEVGLVGIWLAALLTLYTGYDYLRVGLAHMEDTGSASR